MIMQQHLQVDGVAPVVYLNNIVIEQQPVAVALDYGDVVSSVGAAEEERESRTCQLLMISVCPALSPSPATVHYHSNEVIHSVSIVSIV